MQLPELSSDAWRPYAKSGLHLSAASWGQLPGFACGRFLAAYNTFLASAHAYVANTAPTRPACAATPAFLQVCERAVALPALDNEDEGAARTFFTSHFQPFQIGSSAGVATAPNGFLTGYYEPELDGSTCQTPHFTAPVLARPDDLVTFAQGEEPASMPPHLSAGRIDAHGRYGAYPERQAIETGAIAGQTHPIVWLRDAVEVFLVQVQGSARINLQDGRRVRLGYAGRNGHPYTSIGRILIETGEIPEGEMSLARLKQWIRESGEAGVALMRRNKSYVFFKFEDRIGLDTGPVGAAGIALTPLCSIAVDRSLWHYGLPFWIDAALPASVVGDGRFQKLMIAQDTGSAIVGPARADVFFGWGDAAGRKAGDIRHAADLHVLLPAGR